MNKCVVFILTVAFKFVEPSRGCLDGLEIGKFNEFDSGMEAFKTAYYDITSKFVTPKKNGYLSQYYNYLFKTATEGYEDSMLPSPNEWCDAIHKNELVRKKMKEITSYETFSHSYFLTKEDSMKTKNIYALNYFIYLYDAYEPILRSKPLKSPKEFCAGIQSMGQSSINTDQGQNLNAGEGSNRKAYEPLDKQRQFIDLNQPYEEEYMNVNNNEYLDFNQLHEEENKNIHNIENIDLNQPYDEGNFDNEILMQK